MCRDLRGCRDTKHSQLIYEGYIFLFHSKKFFYSNFGAKVQLFLGILNSIDHKMHPMRNFVAKGGALALAFGYKILLVFAT